MRKPVGLFLLFLALAGCGESLAPLDAVVTGPEDGSFTVGPSDSRAQLVRPLEFHVRNADGIALSGIKVELIANNGVITDIDGNLIASPNRPDIMETETDNRGNVKVGLGVIVPPCGAESLTYAASMVASVGVTNDIVTATFTVEEC